MNHVALFSKAMTTVFWEEPGSQEVNIPIAAVLIHSLLLCSSPSTHSIILNFAPVTSYFNHGFPGTHGQQWNVTGFKMN
jgi:hypothetical protein